MTHTIFDQFNDLVIQLAAADDTGAAEHACEILDTELAHEVLAAIVGGQMGRGGNPYEPGGVYGTGGGSGRCLGNNTG